MVEAPKPEPVDDAGPVHETARRLLANVERVVIGKHDEIALVLAALVSGGHVLLENVPGTAKTILARSIAQTIEGAAFSRLQCTPDLQPTDVTGLSIFNQKTREFEFRAGPVFANVVLVANLAGTNLAGANLAGATLAGANLVGANLSRANLTGASLSSATMSDAYLLGTNLSHADLRGATLLGADLSRATMAGAKLGNIAWFGAICPNGKKTTRGC